MIATIALSQKIGPALDNAAMFIGATTLWNTWLQARKANTDPCPDLPGGYDDHHIVPRKLFDDPPGIITPGSIPKNSDLNLCCLPRFGPDGHQEFSKGKGFGGFLGNWYNNMMFVMLLNTCGKRPPFSDIPGLQPLGPNLNVGPLDPTCVYVVQFAMRIILRCCDWEKHCPNSKWRKINTEPDAYCKVM